MTSISSTDVLVVGAGPAGLTLAADLLRRNVSVRLIDQAASPSPTSRATSLTPRVGDRIPDVRVTAGNEPEQSWLHQHLRGTQPALLLLAGDRMTHDVIDERLRALAQDAQRRRLPVLYVVPPGSVRPALAGAIVLTDTDGDLHRRFRARTARSVAIRPDKHIAAIGTARDASVLEIVESLAFRPAAFIIQGSARP